MAREFPIHNGRMTTDLDANGHKIKNLPPGSGFTQVQSDWGQTDTTAPDFIKNKPTIPAPVTIDPALSQTSENPVQNKVVSAALAEKLDGTAAYPAWEDKAYVARSVVSYKGRIWRALANISQGDPDPSVSPDWEEVNINGLKQDALSSAQIGYINAVPNKANAADVNAALALKLNASDVVAPSTALAAAGKPADAKATGDALALKLDRAEAVAGFTEWKVESIADRYRYVSCEWDSNLNAWKIRLKQFNPSTDTELDVAILVQQAADATELVDPVISLSRAKLRPTKTSELTNDGSGGGDPFVYQSQLDIVHDTLALKANAADLRYRLVVVDNGRLVDRAGNKVVVTGNTTLTLPAAVPGYLRDFLVRLEISGSTVPTITFAAPTGETIVYETDGDEFPVPDEAGSWLYSFTESCVAHKFAVSLKKVNTVTQGGS